jgi:hypothetical protein
MMIINFRIALCCKIENNNNVKSESRKTKERVLTWFSHERKLLIATSLLCISCFTMSQCRIYILEKPRDQIYIQVHVPTLGLGLMGHIIFQTLPLKLELIYHISQLATYKQEVKQL